MGGHFDVMPLTPTAPAGIPHTQEATMGWVDWLAENIFALTLALIFASALFSAFVKRRSRDRCLKVLHGNMVTAVLPDGKRVWGTMQVFPQGIELKYTNEHTDRDGHTETSSILFGDQLNKVTGFHRYHADLDEKKQKRRKKQIQKAWHPSLFKRFLPSVRNIANTFRDAFQQSFGMMLSQIQKSPGGAALKGQDKQLKKIGEEALGAAGNAFEPILERHIGRRVVVEELIDEEWGELPGILTDYTRNWLLLLECHLQERQILDLSHPEELEAAHRLKVTVSSEREKSPSDDPVVQLTVSDTSDLGWVVESLTGEDFEVLIEEKLKAGGKLSPTLSSVPMALHPDPDGSAHALKLNIRTTREADLCLPRARAVVRHGSEGSVSSGRKDRVEN